MRKYVFLKQISLLLIAAKLFVDYEVTWFEVFIPVYVGMTVSAISFFLKYIEEKLQEKVDKQC